jgi:hypothetical protein
MNVLVLGGYGNWHRICKALAGHPQIHLLIAGRNASKAQTLADTVGHHTQGVALDHEAPTWHSSSGPSTSVSSSTQQAFSGTGLRRSTGRSAGRLPLH